MFAGHRNPRRWIVFNALVLQALWGLVTPTRHLAGCQAARYGRQLRCSGAPRPRVTRRPSTAPTAAAATQPCPSPDARRPSPLESRRRRRCRSFCAGAMLPPSSVARTPDSPLRSRRRPCRRRLTRCRCSSLRIRLRSRGLHREDSAAAGRRHKGLHPKRPTRIQPPPPQPPSSRVASAWAVVPQALPRKPRLRPRLVRRSARSPPGTAAGCC